MQLPVNYEENKIRDELYIAPFPKESSVRRGLEVVFVRNGFEHVHARIILSIIFHGGMVDLKGIADELELSETRIRNNHVLPELERLGLVGITHHRPKIIILTTTIDELHKRTIGHEKLRANAARRLLTRLDNYYRDKFLSKFQLPHEYQSKIIDLTKDLHSIFYLVDYSLTALRMDRNASVLVGSLILCGGVTPKRSFYKDVIKPFDLKDKANNIDRDSLTKDLSKIGYEGEELYQLVRQVTTFYEEESNVHLPFSTEQVFNVIVDANPNFVYAPYQGKKKSILELTPWGSFSFFGEYLFSQLETLLKLEDSLFEHLGHAMKHVKIPDELRELYFSSFNSTQGFVQKLTVELEHASRVRVKYCFRKGLTETLWLLLNGSYFKEKRAYSVEYIVLDDLQEEFTKDIRGFFKNDALSKDGNDNSITFVPKSDIGSPENGFLFTYAVGRGYLNSASEISERRPAVYSIDPDLFDEKYEIFEKVVAKFSHKTTVLSTLLSLDGSEGGNNIGN